jgi:dienelactone hydrolase/pimeloyl-ACP methyl ester carboxylesterase
MNDTPLPHDITDDTFTRLPRLPHFPHLPRRAMLRGIGLSVASLALPGHLVATAAEPMTNELTNELLPPLPPLPQSSQLSLAPLNRFPRLMQEYFVQRVREIEEQAEKRRSALRTRADAHAYVQDIRRKIQQCFGPWPEKTPLNPRITGTVERDEYRIEKVIFESRPNFLVTANLYIPKGHKFPLPGVVGSCGHTDNGKAAESYQSFAQGLARLGLVCLIFDPIGQGERRQYADEKFKLAAGVPEHQYAGHQQILAGEFFGAWRAWDGIRALDYLLTRDEIDARHVGITGNSGGGTMTTWLCGVERRWTMAAPGCFVTTFRRNLENELSADAEQCPPLALALGLDHADFLAAMAPKPVIIIAQEKDYFDARGAEEAYRRLKHLYTLLGSPDNIALSICPDYHGYSTLAREAMYHWFLRASGQSGQPDQHNKVTEPKLTIEKDEILWCTPGGQIAELRSRPVYSFTRATSEALRKKRTAGLADQELSNRLVKSLRLEDWQQRNKSSKSDHAPEFRILRELRNRRYPRPYFTTYAVETEPQALALVYRLSNERILSRPPRSSDRATLYVAHHSSDAELRDEALLAEILAAERETAFFTCDVRGIGESQPNLNGENNPPRNDYFYAAHSIMLDRPYIGRRTYDLLRVLDWLAACGHTNVHLVGKGWGALPATFAAVLSNQVKQVTLKNALTSYSEIAESEQYAWPLSTLLPGVLESFDLPDCYRTLQRKGLRMIEPWNANASN